MNKMEFVNQMFGSIGKQSKPQRLRRCPSGFAGANPVAATCFYSLMVEQQSYTLRGLGSTPSRSICRYSVKVNTSGFQPDNLGSIPNTDFQKSVMALSLEDGVSVAYFKSCYVGIGRRVDLLCRWGNPFRFKS